MTIKRKSTIRLLGRELQISKTLKPGHEEVVIKRAWNSDMSFKSSNKYKLKVLSDDVLELEEIKERSGKVVTVESFVRFFRDEIREEEMEEYPREISYEGEDINSKMLSSAYEDELHQPNPRPFHDKRIDIVWEPALPSQSRK